MPALADAVEDLEASAVTSTPMPSPGTTAIRMRAGKIAETPRRSRDLPLFLR
jgi:hypothetical protein